VSLYHTRQLSLTCQWKTGTAVYLTGAPVAPLRKHREVKVRSDGMRIPKCILYEQPCTLFYNGNLRFQLLHTSTLFSFTAPPVAQTKALDSRTINEYWQGKDGLRPGLIWAIVSTFSRSTWYYSRILKDTRRNYSSILKDNSINYSSISRDSHRNYYNISEGRVRKL
jgi:hypothetical protein